MSAAALSTLAVVAAYLIGAVPFGYLIARWLKGVDIRTVGSGNIGATNVGRTFGFKFFLLVFAFDLLKGLIPTLGLPALVATLTGKPSPPDLPVLVAIACILGHNFPVYLKFKGGKGVATSLGALTALDPIASLAAGLAFLVSMRINRYVSLSSLFGGVVFAVTHFSRTEAPWSRGRIAMTLATTALLGLLFVRHRANIGRLINGTEPKVNFRKKSPPSGRVAVAWLLSILVVSGLCGAASVYVSHATQPDVLKVGKYTLREVSRVATGHQRADRLAFADRGRLLVVTCPRYLRVVYYKVTPGDQLEPFRDIELEGKPVAVWPTADRLLVLVRPPGDHRHVEPGWWEAYDFDGNAIGGRSRVGFYPDDIAASPDGRHVYVLTSGSAEGGPDRPAPGLDVYEANSAGDAPVSIGRVEFEGAGDDPERFSVSSTGTAAAVTLLGSNAVAAVDLFDPARPTVVGRSALAETPYPYPSRFEGDSLVMPVASGSEGAVVSLEGVGDCVAATMPKGSGLELMYPPRHRSLGRLTLRGGSIGLAKIRPLGLAYHAKRGLIAVSNRAGSVHLVAVREGDDMNSAPR